VTLSFESLEPLRYLPLFSFVISGLLALGLFAVAALAIAALLKYLHTPPKSEKE
jgi:hypothetical protein